MYVRVGDVIGANNLNIEVNGIPQKNVIDLDTSTGLARVYKCKDGKLVIEDGAVVIEDVTFPVDQLHVYLVKPK